MYTGHPTINHLHAEGRRRDMLATAERDRLVAQATTRRIVPNVRAALRWSVGVQMIRAGERIRETVSGAPATT